MSQAHAYLNVNQILFKEVIVACDHSAVIKIPVPNAKHLDKMKPIDACK